MFISIPFYRTLVQFGLMRDFIRHLQKYPVQLNSEEELPTQMKQLAQYVYYIRYFAIVISEKVLNTFTSFDAPSRDVCGWSMHCACAALARRLSRTH